MNIVKNISSNDGNYIAGFTDGEGSFNVSLKRREDYKTNWKIEASFNISQKDRVILAKIKNILTCGTLRERQDGVVYYEVTNIKSLHEIIIPFFERFPFWSAKRKENFQIFKKIIQAMYKNEHMTPLGMKYVLQMRENLNVGAGRKRKYNITDVKIGDN